MIRETLANIGFYERQRMLENVSGRKIGVPYGSRTRVASVKGRCPRPLDERDARERCPKRLRFISVTRVVNQELCSR